MIAANRIFKWYGMLGVLCGLVACTDAGNSASKDATAKQSLQQHVIASLQSLDKAKLKDLGFAPPYDIVAKKFESDYEVQVISLADEEDTGLRARVRLTGSMQDPRSELWLTEVVRLDFIRPNGQGDWKLITYQGQIENYMAQAIPGRNILTLPDPVQAYLKSAFVTLPAKELNPASQ